ncbi:hypothetical protein Baya_11225 [Bagarius yarrelli]|uniref:Uncharacterized protein n=1 Tax=Bagarius yarrelli TaxID=175774 RepID=A0A556V0H6_BAGYA|nr:hypothetical protein Baya_11225 [Bagarius yarrelli]
MNVTLAKVLAPQMTLNRLQESADRTFGPVCTGSSKATSARHIGDSECLLAASVNLPTNTPTGVGLECSQRPAQQCSTSAHHRHHSCTSEAINPFSVVFVLVWR